MCLVFAPMGVWLMSKLLLGGKKKKKPLVLLVLAGVYVLCNV